MFPYKDDNISKHAPVVTVALIAINVVVFLFFRLQGRAVFASAVMELGVIPRELWSGNLPGSEAMFPYVSLLTSMFMHGGWLHLGGNMLYLWIFGDNVEDYLGHVRYLIFYLGCGFVAALSHIAFSLGSEVPMVGASGAIAGVLGAYLVLYPWARVHVLVFLFFFITTVTVPAWIMLGLWFGLQILNSLPSIGTAGGVAYLAHVGGFVGGYGYIRLRARKLKRKTPAWKFKGGFK
jgi:membrane associated rhomboid family serine protease